MHYKSLLAAAGFAAAEAGVAWVGGTPVEALGFREEEMDGFDQM